MTDASGAASGKRAQFSVEAAWDQNPRLVPSIANQVHVAGGVGTSPSGVHITLGHVNPPLLVGEPTQEQIAQMGPAPVVIVGAYYLPIDAARDLHRVLTELLSSYEDEGIAELDIDEEPPARGRQS